MADEQNAGTTAEVGGEFADVFAQLAKGDAPGGAQTGQEGAAGATGTDAGAAGATGTGGAGEGTGDGPGGLPDPGSIGADGQPVGATGTDAGAAGATGTDGGAAGATGPAAGATGTDGGAAGATGPASDQAGGRLTDQQFLEQFRQIMQPDKGATGAGATGAAQEPAIQPYSTDEQKLLADYEREWPDVSKAEELKRSREYQGVVAHIFKELQPFFDQLRALQGTTQAVATDSYVTQLRTAVPDYDAVAPKVAAWVNQQPAILQPAYKAVMEKGTLQDVVSLIGLYRKGTNTPEPKPAGQQQGGGQQQQAGGQQQGNKGKVPDPKAIAGLAPVGSKRTTAAPGAGPETFEDAFKVAAKEAAESLK